MPPVNPAEKLNDAPIADLVVLLLKQFKRLLLDHDIQLTSDAMAQIGQSVSDHRLSGEQIKPIRAVIVQLVHDSLNLLQTRWNLSFRDSLAADMTAIGGWQTTAEFLEIANEKSNAELRISAGASLLMALGDARFVPQLLDVIEYDAGANDVDATIARRMVSHASGISPDVGDWHTRIEAWYHAQA